MRSVRIIALSMVLPGVYACSCATLTPCEAVERPVYATHIGSVRVRVIDRLRGIAPGRETVDVGLEPLMPGAPTPYHTKKRAPQP